MTKKAVCVDLDGTLADYRDGWRGEGHIGDPVPGAVEFTRALAKDYRVVVYTTRCKTDFDGRPPGETPQTAAARVEAWLARHGFAYDEVYVGQGKPFAVAYVDDRSVECRPQKFGAGEFQAALESVAELAGK